MAKHKPGAELLDELEASLRPVDFLDGLQGEGELGGAIVATGYYNLLWTKKSFQLISEWLIFLLLLFFVVKISEVYFFHRYL